MNPPALRPKSTRQKAGTVRAAKTPKAVALGTLPEWDLSALYPGMDSAEFAADLARGEAACKEFAETYRGRLEELVKAPEPSKALAAAVKRYEEIEDLLGRVMSYAGLVYTGDTTDPKRAKFYGDTQERLTAASSELLFFTLELNRIDDKLLDAAAGARTARALPAVARGHPQGQALPARRQARATVPRKIDHRARRLEPAVRRDHREPAL